MKYGACKLSQLTEEKYSQEMCVNIREFVYQIRGVPLDDRITVRPTYLTSSTSDCI